MAGVQNIVAPQGTAFTDQHARIIKRYANEVVLCFDSDNAGQNAIVRSLDHLLASGLAVRVAVVPSPHDPDSFIKANGGEAFQKLVASAEGFFDYYLNRLCATNEINSDKGRLVVLRSMAESVQKTGNSVLIDTYAQKTALRLGVSVDAIRKEFSKIKMPMAIVRTEDKPDDLVPADEMEAEVFTRPSQEEFTLIKLLLEYDNSVEHLSKTMDSNWFPSQISREIFSRRIHLFKTDSWAGLNEFLAECSEPAIQSFVTECLTKPLVPNTDGYKSPRKTELPNPEIQLADVALKLRNQFLDRQIATLTQKISQPETGDDERLSLLREQMKLKEQKRLPLSPVEK